MLAATIFTLGIVRDHLYQLALLEQPVHPTLLHPAVRVAAVLLFAVGTVPVSYTHLTLPTNREV